MQSVKKRHRFFWICVVLVTSPLFAFAQEGTDIDGADTMTLGMSPPRIEVTLYDAMVREEQLTMMRSHTVGDMTFTVTATDSPLIDIPEGTTVTIPDGAQTVVYPLVLDATAVAEGDYTSLVTFTYTPPQIEGVTNVAYALTTQVLARVAPWPSPDTALSLSLFPSLHEWISVTQPSLRTTRGDGVWHVALAWDVENAGIHPLRDLVTTFRLTKGEHDLLVRDVTFDGAVAAGNTLTQTYAHDVSYAYGSGWYALSVTGPRGDVVTHRVLLLTPRVLRFCSGALVLVAAGVGAVVTLRFQAARRGHR